VIASGRDPLDQAATLGRVDIALESSAVPDVVRARVRAIASRTPNQVEWSHFLASALLLLGAGLVLSGLISFFAFNWAALGRFTKMGLIAAAMTVCAATALRRPDTLLSRVLLTAAAVLVGALLAVYGQTYQTGADPWGLFATWALLILPWALAACFTPLWLLVVGLLDVAHVLYVAQVWQGKRWELTLVLGLVAVHVLAVMTWEAQYLRREPWLREQWGPRVLLVTALALLLGPSLAIVINPEWRSPLGPVSVVGLTFLVVTTGLYYRLVRPDTFMLTAAAGSVMTLLTTVVGRLLIVTLHLGVLGMFMMTGLIIVEVTLAVSWLRRRVREDMA
jgi:uncharacterized membrane protein